MEKLVKNWKKALESDLQYITGELKEEIQTPAVIFLEGNLGAGKTTLCQYFCDKQVLSPTYAILSEYHNILHADFYRIEHSDEFVHLELAPYLEGKEYFFAEWGLRWIDQLVALVPDHYHYYKIKIEESTDQAIRPIDRKNLRDISLHVINPLA